MGYTETCLASSKAHDTHHYFIYSDLFQLRYPFGLQNLEGHDFLLDTM